VVVSGPGVDVGRPHRWSVEVSLAQCADRAVQGAGGPAGIGAPILSSQAGLEHRSDLGADGVVDVPEGADHVRETRKLAGRCEVNLLSCSC
jgi:hypothetical protein